MPQLKDVTLFVLVYCWWSLLLKSLINDFFVPIIIISSKYSYHENLQTGWPYLPIFVNGYINKDCSIKYLYLYKVNWYMIKWFYTFSIYKKVTECMLNLFSNSRSLYPLIRTGFWLLLMFSSTWSLQYSSSRVGWDLDLAFSSHFLPTTVLRAGW